MGTRYDAYRVKTVKGMELFPLGTNGLWREYRICSVSGTFAERFFFPDEAIFYNSAVEENFRGREEAGKKVGWGIDVGP